MMGKIKGVALAIALLVGVCLQSFGMSIPRKVLRQMNSMFPNAEQVDWRRNHGYEANFRVDNKTGSVIFNHRGNVLYSKMDVALNELPISVTNSLNSGFIGNGYEPETAMHRWSARDGEAYDVMVNKGMDEYLLRYSPDGALISQYDMSKIDRGPRASRF